MAKKVDNLRNKYYNSRWFAANAADVFPGLTQALCATEPVTAGGVNHRQRRFFVWKDTHGAAE